MAGAGRGNHANENTGHRLTPLKLNAFAFIWASTGSTPFVDNLQALALMRSFTKRPSAGDHSRFDCMFGSKMRRVLLFACDTLFPVRDAFQSQGKLST